MVFALTCAVVLVFGAAPAALAHAVSDSYLKLQTDPSGISGQWSLGLHDLEVALGLDANGDSAITWGELKARKDAVREYAASRLALEMDGQSATLDFAPDLQVDHLANGGYAVLQFHADGPGDPGILTVTYQAIFDDNPLHRGLLTLDHHGQTQQAIFSPTEPRLRLELSRPRPGREFARFTWEGVWHIWIGYDHILFLLALLLPSVLRRDHGRWMPVDDLRGAFWNVLRIVTAFTLAHSITLSLAALDVVRLPSRLVESAIAGSIVIAALNNVRPVATTRTWGIAFAFGLIHGFGFASVLAGLGLPRGSLARALVAFNLGVELGQVALVAAFLPLAHGLRGTSFYRVAILRGGSVAVALVAAWWMVERLRGA